jgi:hypothetical protein
LPLHQPLQAHECDECVFPSLSSAWCDKQPTSLWLLKSTLWEWLPKQQNSTEISLELSPLPCILGLRVLGLTRLRVACSTASSPSCFPHPMVQCIKPTDAHSPIPSSVGVEEVHLVLSDLGPRSTSPQATQQCLAEYLVIYKVLKVPNTPCFHLLWIHT